MARHRFLSAAPIVTLLGLFACGGGDDSTSPTKEAESRSEALCRQISDYAKQCGASAGTCDQALVADCANVVGLLSDPFIEGVSACLGADKGASPMACFTQALSTLEPGTAQVDLVKGVCKTCTDIPLAPASLQSSCESAFIEGFDVPKIGHIEVGALFAVLGDRVAGALQTECVTSVTDCVPAKFGTCAEKVLVEQGVPQDSVACFASSILGGTSPGTSSGSCVPASGAGGSSSASSTSGTSGSSTSATSGSSNTSSSTGAGGSSTSASTGTGGGPSTAQACFNKVITVDDSALTKGDAEFGGHGPKVDVSVTLARTSATVTATTCVVMTETVSDWSTGQNCVIETIPVDNAGLVTMTQNTLTYTDTDHALDNAIAEASSIMIDPALVLSADCQGDHDGTDICNGPDCSHCSVALGCVTVITP